MNQFLTESVWLVPSYGLLGAILTLPWSLGLIRRTGPRPAAYLNLVLTVVALIHCSVVLFGVWDLPPQQTNITWLQTADLNLSLALEVSKVTAGAAVLVSAISTLAQIYALGSMEMDWGLARFFALMGFFEGAMTSIAFSDSLFLSYAFLEMLTLSTYLLVGFWYAQPLVVTAARDAFWTKRIGDLILLMGVVALSTLAPSLNFSDLAEWAAKPETQDFFASHVQIATLLGLALIAGPTGKCAQFPLHLWLDEAMEGPNPASILRNSVVVSCGAYVLIKLQPVLALFPVALSALVILGTITAVGASLVAIAQIDLKRALSHLTSSHLGLVFIAVGMQQDDIAFYFLFTHAIAKALLFMSSGAVMMVSITQDLTEMGGLRSRMPATTIAYIVGGLGSVALLPLGNFWTMLEWVDSFWPTYPWLIAVLLLVNSFTAFALIRVYCLVFLGQSQPKTRRAPEVPWLTAVPMVSLTIVTLLVPWMLASWQLLPDWSSLNWITVALLAGSGGLGIAVAWRIYLWPYETGSTVSLPPRPIRLAWKSLQDLLAYDLYVLALYRVTVVFLVEKGSRTIAWVDRYIVDGLVNLMGFASVFTGETLKYTVSGRSQQYLFTILLGTILASVATLIWLQ